MLPIKFPSYLGQNYSNRKQKRNYVILFIFFLSILLSSQDDNNLYGFKYQWEKDKEIADVNNWKDVLTQKKHYKLINIENFEKGLIWIDGSKLSYSTRLELISNIPEEKAYQNEQKILEQFTNSGNGKTSLSVHTHFTYQGKEIFLMKPRVPIFVKGYLKRFSIWVYSNDYKHALELVMLDTFKKRHFVRIGKLDFRGWKRFDIALPKEFSTRNKRSNEPYRSDITGLLIRSNHFEKRDSCHIIIDNFNFLVDRTEWIYPGSEIRDNWGDFIDKRPIR
jgi:hypothetical protein